MVTYQGVKKITLNSEILYMEGKGMIAYEEHLVLVSGLEKVRKRLKDIMGKKKNSEKGRKTEKYRVTCVK